jgi:hypothetical protein
MPTASEKIADGSKPKASKAKTKMCGFPGCRDAAAAGGKLKVTPLESGQYPTAEDGHVSTCKFHRMCVGFDGLDPDTDQGTFTKPACGDPGKVIYLNRPFCMSCHMVYAWALLAQLKPKLTSDLVLTVRRKVVADNVKPVPEEVDEDTASVEALRKQLAKAEAKVGGKKPGGKKGAVTAAAATKTKQVKKPVAPPPEESDDVSESVEETDEMEVSPKAAGAAPSKDDFEALEDVQTKEAAVPQSSPTGPASAASATIVSDPLKAAAAKAKKAVAAVAKV